MDQVKIGRFIAQLRKEQGLTQSQLAEKLNISNRTVSKWETGGGMPDVSLLAPLCEALSITADELFMGERAPEPIEDTVNDTTLEEPPKKKTVPAKRIILTILAIALVIALSALTTCQFLKKTSSSAGTPTGALLTGTPEASTLTPYPSQAGTLATDTPEPSNNTAPTPTEKIIYVPGTDKIIYITPVPTAITRPTAIPTKTPTPTPAPTAMYVPGEIPDMPYGGYKFASIEGKQSQWPYYYINCGMNTSPLSKYSSYTGTLTLSYEVFNPTSDTISVCFYVQTLYDDWWCYLSPNPIYFKDISPYSKETVTVEFPVKNGNIDFCAKDGSTVSVNAEKAFLRFDIKFPNLTKAGNTVYILANSSDDPILSGDWYSTGYMIPEKIN